MDENFLLTCNSALCIVYCVLKDYQRPMSQRSSFYNKSASAEILCQPTSPAPLHIYPQSPQSSEASFSSGRDDEDDAFVTATSATSKVSETERVVNVAGVWVRQQRCASRLTDSPVTSVLRLYAIGAGDSKEERVQHRKMLEQKVIVILSNLTVCVQDNKYHEIKYEVVMQWEKFQEAEQQQEEGCYSGDSILPLFLVTRCGYGREVKILIIRAFFKAFNDRQDVQKLGCIIFNQEDPDSWRECNV